MKKTAEEFLREKLGSEISSFGDGTTEFHTRDIEHLLQCMDAKDETIQRLENEKTELFAQINFSAERRLKELLGDVMTINNLSADQRLSYIRKTYKQLHEKLNT